MRPRKPPPRPSKDPHTRQPPGRKITDEQKAEIRRRLYAGERTRAVAEATGIGIITVQKHKRALLARLGEIEAAARPLPKGVPDPGFRVTRRATRHDRAGAVTGESIETRREPGDVFEVPAGHKVKGRSALVDPQGRTLVEWIKTAEDGHGPALVDALREAFAGYQGLVPLVPPPADTDAALLTVYPLADLHLGMQSWRRETGENYDLKIARARVLAVTGALVAQSRPSRHAVILGLGDYFHSNDATAMTPRSKHLLDVDGRWPRVLATGVQTAMAMAELAAQKHETVSLRFLPGNHDPDAAIALTVALAVAYAGNPRITVDDDPSHVWYRRHGRVMLGATHGHTMKPDRMAMMLATDRPRDWGETDFRHFFFGHVHHESAREVGAVRVESFNTLAARDAYAAAGGWRSGQAMSAITFCGERGEIGRHRVNITKDI